MTLKTSTHFASAFAQGTNWRDTSKSVLEKLEGAITDKDEFTLGFLYITDDLAEDASSILNLFRSVTSIENWVGCTAVGVFANGEDLIDSTAISAMICRIPEDDFVVSAGTSLDVNQSEKILQSWMDKNDPFCSIVHGDPVSEQDITQDLHLFEQMSSSFLVGGLSSSRTGHVQFANDVVDGGVSGVVFNSSQSIVTGLTQGCKPISEVHTVTQAHDNMIMELDGVTAFQMFTDDIRDYARRHLDRSDRRNLDAKEKAEQELKTDIDTDSPVSEAENQSNDEQIQIQDIEDIIAPVREIFQGDIHVGLPIEGSDIKDYTVRNIIGLDPEHGWISVGKHVSKGDKVLFVRRDHDSIEQDLSKMLLNIRKRYQSDFGVNSQAKGGIYISCLARAGQEFSSQSSDVYSDKQRDKATSEITLIKEIIGDIPIVGYFASGEVSNARLYGFTGILILFH